MRRFGWPRSERRRRVSRCPATAGNQEVSLEEARREWPVVLFFYPGDWSLEKAL